ncbi:MAG TPA: hypothetical protein VKV04_06425 [Verrucomicrobiae bacterium]|nr:hypothetical protein [Verrucomicrobiae bacterium]
MNENEMNLLENQLRSWKPRRPSPRLKRRLFGPTVQREAITLSLRWLAPAGACLLMAVGIVRQDPGFAMRSSGTGPLLGMVSNHLSYTNLLPHNRSSGDNGVLPANFEWTNGGTFTSNVSPFLPIGID